VGTPNREGLQEEKGPIRETTWNGFSYIERSLARVRRPVATTTRTNRLTTTTPIINYHGVHSDTPPFQLAASQRTLLIDQLIPTICALYFAVRADAICALRWQVRLRCLNIVRQSLADFGIGKDSLAVFTGESPARHAGLSPPVTDVGIPRLVYSSRWAWTVKTGEGSSGTREPVPHRYSA
jgi:hypothetical protein